MKKKIFIQVVLILLIICFSYFLYKKYFFLDMANNKIVNDRSIKKDDKMNVINNLNYNSSDAEGRSYNIKAESGSMDILDTQVIKMNNVIANIKRRWWVNDNYLTLLSIIQLLMKQNLYLMLFPNI